MRVRAGRGEASEKGHGRGKVPLGGVRAACFQGCRSSQHPAAEKMEEGGGQNMSESLAGFHREKCVATACEPGVRDESSLRGCTAESSR